jgi:hypothetical protein
MLGMTASGANFRVMILAIFVLLAITSFGWMPK